MKILRKEFVVFPIKRDREMLMGSSEIRELKRRGKKQDKRLPFPTYIVLPIFTEKKFAV